MKETELKDLENLYKTWSTEELLKATTFEKENYRPEAITLMKKELEKRNISQLEREMHITDIEKKTEKEIKSLSGIKGFLLLFVLILLNTSIILIFGGLNYLSLVSLITAIPLFGAGTYGIYTFFLLVRKKTNALKHTRNWIILTFMLSIIYGAINYLAFGDKEASFPMFSRAFTASIMFGYLSYSKRVAATYRKADKK